MRILIISQTFLPEMGAPSNRLYPLARHLVEDGHEVFVATCMPNYPAGVVFPAYRGKRFCVEQMDGMTIVRTSQLVCKRNRSKWRQLVSYLSFIPAALRSGLHIGPVDVVFMSSPPLFVAFPGMWISRIRGAKLILDLRDLWPDEIVACGGASDESAMIKIVRAIERRAYRAADCITCTTNAMADTVSRRGAASEKIVLLPNGADTDRFVPLPASNPVTDQFPFGDRFVAMYAGVLGLKHDLETVLEAASMVRSEKQILFVLAGNGAQYDHLVQRAAQMKLDNVLFTGEHGVEEVPYMLARADLCLSSLLPHPYLEKIISVKIFEYLACGKPVVAAQEGEGANIVRACDGGIVVPPEDAAAMASAILELYRDPERRASMGRRGKQYVEQNYSRRVIAERLGSLMKSLYAETASKSGIREPANVQVDNP